MSNKTSSGSGGMGFFSVLLIVFITLKLCKVIDWSWWIVLSPLWVSLTIATILLMFYAFVCYMAEREKQNFNKKYSPRK